VSTLAKLRGDPTYWQQRYEEWWDLPFHGMSQATDEFMALEEQGIRTKLPALLRPDHRVLDAGCGYGRIAPIICPLVREYVGVDFSDKAIAAARESAPANARFVVGDIGDLKEQPFNVVVMVGVASSISYRSAGVIDHLRSLLLPGGVIAVFEYGHDRIIDTAGVSSVLA
jgi:SAM-dependent methyltransferase